MKKHAKTWWGRRFLDVLEAFTEPRRLVRGRQYLNNRRIGELRVEGSRVEARVRGHSSPYYGIYEEPVYLTRIEFTPVPAAAWERVIRHIGERAGFVSRLLFNEMPDEIETPMAAQGVGLLPRNRADLATRCSCPDAENPCKHVAGLYFLLAARLDHDPFLLFELRGLPRAELARRLKATPLGAALGSALVGEPAELRPVESYFTRPRPLPVPDAVPVRDYWRGARRLPAGVEMPSPAAVSAILIRKGGDYPPFWTRDESFVEVMDAFYEQVRKKGKDWM